MKARTRKQLLFAGETPESLRAALDEHSKTKAEFAGSEQASRQWLDRLHRLSEELGIMEGPPYAG